VNPADPNVQRVETVAAALGDLRDELVLVGGCAVSLLVDAPTAPATRVTFDVDLVAEVAGLADYHALERQFTKRGFKQDAGPGAPICRWKIGGIIVDLVPTDEKILGFSNPWYRLGCATAMPLTLPSGTDIHLIPAPAFLATKFEAYRSRGASDPLLSHDLEDIINIVEGRTSIVEEARNVAPELSRFLAEQFSELQAMPEFGNLLPGLVMQDGLYAERLDRVRQRILAIASGGKA
jgi:predicted nucleotidyltransferase